MTTFQYICYLLICLIVFAIGIAAGIYLITTEHYGWAWIPFVLSLSFTVSTNSKPNGDNKN